ITASASCSCPMRRDRRPRLTQKFSQTLCVTPISLASLLEPPPILREALNTTKDQNNEQEEIENRACILQTALSEAVYNHQSAQRNPDVDVADELAADSGAGGTRTTRRHQSQSFLAGCHYEH